MFDKVGPMALQFTNEGRWTSPENIFHGFVNIMHNKIVVGQIKITMNLKAPPDQILNSITAEPDEDLIKFKDNFTNQEAKDEWQRIVIDQAVKFIKENFASQICQIDIPC